MSKAYIVCGLGFGDEGKGATVDHLARRHPHATVVRHNGGAQALHHVVDGDRVHGFAQFGSGSFVPTIRTHLSRFMLVNPLNMLPEAAHLHSLGVADIFERTTVDRRAQIITPYHRALNRLRELGRGTHRHGSCGQGIGETVADYIARGFNVPFMGDFSRPALLIDKLARTREVCVKTANALVLPGGTAVDRELAALEVGPLDVFGAYARVPVNFANDEDLAGDLIFEGAQGVLLDENHGFSPHTTWSTTTDHNAKELLLGCDYQGDVQTLGVIRSYMTRHGPGPFETEVTNGRSWRELELLELGEPHNDAGEWMGHWRVGWLDIPVLRYAISCCQQIDGLVMTHVDRVPDHGFPVRTEENTLRGYPILQADYPETVAKLLELPLVMTSHGQTAVDRRDLQLETK